LSFLFFFFELFLLLPPSSSTMATEQQVNVIDVPALIDRLRSNDPTLVKLNLNSHFTGPEGKHTSVRDLGSPNGTMDELTTRGGVSFVLKATNHQRTRRL
jgi:hypothetical protein